MLSRRASFFRRAEQECLCNSDVAYSVVQCFSAQYNNLTSDASRAAYYEDFLTYTYVPYRLGRTCPAD